MNIRASIAAVALAVIVSGGGAAAQTDIDSQMAFYSHVGRATEAMPSDDLSAYQSWATDEIEWLYTNPPESCYGSVWGRWLVVVEDVRLVGLLYTQGEATAALAISTDVASTLPETVAEIKASVGYCIGDTQ